MPSCGRVLGGRYNERNGWERFLFSKFDSFFERELHTIYYACGSLYGAVADIERHAHAHIGIICSPGIGRPLEIRY